MLEPAGSSMSPCATPGTARCSRKLLPRRPPVGTAGDLRQRLGAPAWSEWVGDAWAGRRREERPPARSAGARRAPLPTSRGGRAAREPCSAQGNVRAGFGVSGAAAPLRAGLAAKSAYSTASSSLCTSSVENHVHASRWQAGRHELAAEPGPGEPPGWLAALISSRRSKSSQRSTVRSPEERGWLSLGPVPEPDLRPPCSRPPARPRFGQGPLDGSAGGREPSGRGSAGTGPSGSHQERWEGIARRSGKRLE